MVHKDDTMADFCAPNLAVEAFRLQMEVFERHPNLDVYASKIYSYLLYSMVKLNKISFNHSDRFIGDTLGFHRTMVIRHKALLRDRGLINYVTESHRCVYEILNVGTPQLQTQKNIGTPQLQTRDYDENVGTPQLQTQNVGTPQLQTQKNIGTPQLQTRPMANILEAFKKNVGTPQLQTQNVGTPQLQTAPNVGTPQLHNNSSSSINNTSTKRENTTNQNQEGAEKSISQIGAVTNIEYLKSDEFLKIVMDTVPSANDARGLIHSFYNKNKSRTYADSTKMIEHWWNWLDIVLANEKQKQLILAGWNNKLKSEQGIKFDNVKVALMNGGISKDVVNQLRLVRYEDNELVINTYDPVIQYLESEENIEIYKQAIRSNYGKCKLTYTIRKSK
jgi:hypothetical protein